MKIAYLIPGTYRAAGMERVLANKTSWLARHGYDVTVITTDQDGRSNAFDFDGRVEFSHLSIGYESTNGSPFIVKACLYPFKRIRHRFLLSRELRRISPDITVSMFCNEVTFLWKLKDGSAKILESHFNRFKTLQYGRTGLWLLVDKFRSHVYEKTVRRYDRFVVLTEEDRNYWGAVPGISVIPNASTFRFDKRAGLRNKVVLAVGRYTHQKNFEALVEAWSRISPEIRGGWVLRIAGDGERRDMILEKAFCLGVDGQIVFGKASDMRGLYLDSSIMALSSRYEGLPMALVEAQSAGLPVVSFACKCGPKDIVHDGEDGFLVEYGDVDAMARRLSDLMSDNDLRQRMGAAAFAASSRFDEEMVMGKWTALFEDICRERKS